MPAFLLKTEPDCYAFPQLVADGRTVWDGITNAAALGHLRRARRGDLAFIYHTADERAIVGAARVDSDPYEDPSQPGLNARGEPKFAVVDLVVLGPAGAPLTLDHMKRDPRFAGFELLRLPRLGVVPVPERLEPLILDLADLRGVVGAGAVTPPSRARPAAPRR